MAAELSLVAGAGGIAPPRPVQRDPLSRQAGERWTLPSPAQPTLSEVFAVHPRDGGWTGFVLAQLDPAKPLLWVQERMAILESGRVHPPGLGVPDLIHVETRDARSALWAMEEGIRCAGLSAVIGEIWGDPAALDFTATRRLAVAAERSGVAAFLIRLGGHANLSGARMRWRIASLPSLVNRFDARAPGPSAWDAELFRARGRAPGRWSIADEPQAGHAHRLHILADAGDRTLGESQRRSA